MCVCSERREHMINTEQTSATDRALVSEAYITTKTALEKQAPQHMDTKNKRRNAATKAR